ncbi:MAG: 2,3-bisphosphoglycerate-independent phosphoglycerate mutase [Thermodesulfobacteriota bacterium]|nr:2,3-bisphosphoglycerate-independent phosphoglycerate mutase [Thermodesulfobacteriota bacterium]
MDPSLLTDLLTPASSKIVFIILDGVGGIQVEEKGGTELQAARKPNLDQLAEVSSCGLLEPISPGITPGSGPAHFALFGYDPFQYNIGRGILEATGIDFPLTERDVVARINYATIDNNGKVIDRRAGRISNETNERICRKLKGSLQLSRAVEVIVEPVKEHRAVLVLRGEGLRGEIEDTDPEREGVLPFKPKAMIPEAEGTAKLVEEFISQSQNILADEPKANMVLLRGFAKHTRYPSMKERYGLNALAIAAYPMYRGISRLVGMSVVSSVSTLKEEFKALADHFAEYDFFFLHVKQTDSRGEDGDFDAKVAVIEEVDQFIPQVRAINPDVLVVTGDHSTPAKLRSHSWHPLPVILHSQCCLIDPVKKFDEVSCISGVLGKMPSVQLMPLALAHARRLTKFGA